MRSKQQQYEEYMNYDREPYDVHDFDYYGDDVEEDYYDEYDDPYEEAYPYVTDDWQTEETTAKRARYSAKLDRFLTNGIIITTVLLIAVLLIAFLV